MYPCVSFSEQPSSRSSSRSCGEFVTDVFIAVRRLAVSLVCSGTARLSDRSHRSLDCMRSLGDDGSVRWSLVDRCLIVDCLLVIPC